MNINEPTAPEPASSKDSGVLQFNAEKYFEYFEDCELTEDQKTEFLRTLWDIMATFVRLGFNVDSVLPAIFQRALENGANALEQTIPTHEFNIAADDEAAEKEE